MDACFSKDLDELFVAMTDFFDLDEVIGLYFCGGVDAG